ncbi:hypothetical protein BJ508DRAFT_313315 [Ascobolus immersus RN42]|uniref:Uncharacterized protein n=1 Tax=Ascobolus immersus RN42 TaxID=1160509 RepID=A0A3N4HWC2_ASCIM|nr:hypothetical protein BJ508DRAFT_313315 [Ascobolus immersus RN42]
MGKPSPPTSRGRKPIKSCRTTSMGPIHGEDGGSTLTGHRDNINSIRAFNAVGDYWRSPNRRNKWKKIPRLRDGRVYATAPASVDELRNYTLFQWFALAQFYGWKWNIFRHRRNGRAMTIYTCRAKYASAVGVAGRVPRDLFRDPTIVPAYLHHLPAPLPIEMVIHFVCNTPASAAYQSSRLVAALEVAYRISHSIELDRAPRDGHSYRFRLTTAEYRQFEDIVINTVGFRRYTFKWWFTKEIHLLSIEMPLHIHDCLQINFTAGLEEGINAAWPDDPEYEEFRPFTSGTSDVSLYHDNGEKFTFQPDNQVSTRLQVLAYEIPYPSLVVEVAISQTIAELAHKLDAWICNGKGRMSVACGIWCRELTSYQKLPECGLLVYILDWDQDKETPVRSKQLFHRQIVDKFGNLVNENYIFKLRMEEFFYVKKQYADDPAFPKMPKCLEGRFVEIPFKRIHKGIKKTLSDLNTGKIPKTKKQLAKTRTNSSEAPKFEYQTGKKYRKFDIDMTDEDTVADLQLASVETLFFPATTVNNAERASQPQPARRTTSRTLRRPEYDDNKMSQPRYAEFKKNQKSLHLSQITSTKDKVTKQKSTKAASAKKRTSRR